MSTDRELLELAAKAAGIRIDKSSSNGGGHGNDGFDVMGNVVLDWRNGITWNPLADDGDALRLAVSMNMGISIYDVQVTAASVFGVPVKEHDKDTAKATRRAIVRAAAEIGRAIP